MPPSPFHPKASALIYARVLPIAAEPIANATADGLTTPARTSASWQKFWDVSFKLHAQQKTTTVEPVYRGKKSRN